MDLIIFDFDGTIADSFEIFIEATNCLAEDFGYAQLSPAKIAQMRQLSLSEMVQNIDVPKWKLPFFLNRFRQELKRLTPQLKLVNGMKRALLTLNEKGYRFGIVTSNSRKNVECFLCSQQLHHLFDFTYGNQILSGKAKTLEKIVQQQQIAPQTLIFVGDEIGDVKAAKQTGLSSIAVSWGFNDPQVLAQHSPDFLVNRPYELVSVIAKQKRVALACVTQKR